MKKTVIAAVLAVLALGTMANKCTVTNTPAQPSQTEQKAPDTSTQPQPETPKE